MMDINKFVDGQMAAWARNDMIGMLADAGHALVQTGLKVNGVRYQDMLVGPLTWWSKPQCRTAGL